MRILTKVYCFISVFLLENTEMETDLPSEKLLKTHYYTGKYVLFIEVKYTFKNINSYN